MNQQSESKILGVSARGWLAFIVIATVCIMSAWGRTVDEPLNAMVHIMVGFYFGQKNG